MRSYGPLLYRLEGAENSREPPGATPEQARWFNELQRISTSPDNAVRLSRALSEIDVRELLPRVRVPTLVLHSRQEAAVPFAAGRELASRIPDARFVPLESSNHLILEHEAAWPRFLREVREFLGEPAASDGQPREPVR